MRGYKTLFLDETGKADPEHRSKSFVLCGCSLENERREELRKSADEIIFKYWGSYKSYRRKYGKKEIVFHARPMASSSGEFKVLEKKEIRRNFWKDFYNQLLCKTYITYHISVFDKVKGKDWGKQKVLKRSYEAVLIPFIKSLIKGGFKGEVIAESSYDQDTTLVAVLNTLQRNSKKYFNINKIDEVLTALTLVNKFKNEIGAQIADVMAWTGKNKFLIDGSYKNLAELRPEELGQLKMFKKRLSSRVPRYKFNSFEILP